MIVLKIMDTKIDNLFTSDLINDLLEILGKGTSFDQSLQQFCDVVSDFSVNGINVSIRVSFNGKSWSDKNFSEASFVQRTNFQTPDRKQGIVELFFSVFSGKQEVEFIPVYGKKLLQQLTPLLISLISKFQLDELYLYTVERDKELKSINRTAEILKKSTTLDESLQEICLLLPEAMQYPEYTVARIKYGKKEFVSRSFIVTEWKLQQVFDMPDGTTGSIEIYYLKKFPDSFIGPFLEEEQSLVNNLAALISGTVSKKVLQQLLVENTERLKELKGINRTSEILTKGKSMEESLQVICSVLPDAWQYPEYTSVRIKYNGREFVSRNFNESEWRMTQGFVAPGRKKGTIDIFYSKQFPEANEGPFLKEERNLLVNLSNLISGSVTREEFKKLYRANTERLKELKAINQTSFIIEEGNPIDETLQAVCSILPDSFQYPKFTVARIRFESGSYTSENFRETEWTQKENFVTIDHKKGQIEIFYLKQFPEAYEGPFLFEERNLLVNISKLICGYLNGYKGHEIISQKGIAVREHHPSEEFRKSLIRNKKPLQLYFNQQSIDKYIYLDMMKFKVKHILFVATLYDAFILESEDSFFEKFMGEIYQYSLFSVPRITGVSTAEEALDLLKTTHFDLVILMAGIDREAPIIISEQIRAANESLPIYLLLNKKSDIRYFEELAPTIRSVDKLFVWNGDSQILFAIVKSTEDSVNVENDTKIGLVRVILLIEDSPLYYSKYLQILYDIVFGQVQQLLPEVEKNEIDKICKMRSRPKILLARNYEDAIYIFNKYKDFMLCVISDVEFERSGKMDKNAGVRFIKYVQSHISNLPVILQSSENRNAKIAEELNAAFINKNSETLLNEIRAYLKSYLGFGNFVFRDKESNKIAVAKSLREFETLLHQIPDESFYLHASENQLSLWLMARGEIQLAKTLNPIQIDNFKSMSESRQFFIDQIKKYKDEKKKGKILDFDETSTLDEKNIVSFAGGSLGGKGRGLAFINILIYNLDFSTLSNRINIFAPITVIIGTDEFQTFITRNNLFDKIIDPSVSFAELRRLFAEAHLSSTLLRKLKVFVSQIDKPIAVRSSSTSEDSITQPFAGVFDTYMVPNCSTNKKIVLEQLATAIKLIYASTFSDKARNYFAVIHHKIEEEKMAVVLQELVGNQYGDYYYPHISGVAKSYNYYPVAHMKPNEGFAVAAVGLGAYVVDGWQSFRFSPKYPKTGMYSIKDLLNSSQVEFYALNCKELKADFLKDGELASLDLLDISEAEKHGALAHCVSVYNPENDRLEAGLSSRGPRVINFANILQYDYIPLAETIRLLLNTIKEAFGSPVEIEYAVDLNRTKNGLPTFYLLQIKPLLADQPAQSITIDMKDKSKMVLFTKSSMGNGIVNGINDVIFADPKRFNKMKTLEMAEEIEALNKIMSKSERQYILIGPGRWGSRDRFVGVPVNWSQISNAKVIVEVSLENFPLDSSLGSHFFHNVTSMNIGYLSVQHTSSTDFLRWDSLNEQKVIHETKFFKHVRFKKDLTIIMDGKQRTAAIMNEE
ncbi:MAG TPA: hypothetical protein DD458_15930 [Prolixibacteraceae bacterium]|nr:hypothetical protein [Prolixibacteraceae bacterium]HCR91711.1 hypothetical protein [Prolixibacteraceae bacterium]HCU62904.1 hypothetical protein [Prolixibacteraceae bacterium]